MLTYYEAKNFSHESSPARKFEAFVLYCELLWMHNHCHRNKLNCLGPCEHLGLRAVSKDHWFKFAVQFWVAILYFVWFSLRILLQILRPNSIQCLLLQHHRRWNPKQSLPVLFEWRREVMEYFLVMALTLWVLALSH